MTQEDKELLLIDLCRRLPYEVKFRYKYIDGCFHEKYGTNTLYGVIPPYRIIHSTLVGEDYLKIEEDEVKPYLFPLSSMTEEQRKEFDTTLKYLPAEEIDIWTHDTYDWCDKNHFDYRGLIPMGLANDATGLNIY
jgi:hypothetical protein